MFYTISKRNCVFQNWCMMMYSPYGRQSGRRETSVPLTLCCSLHSHLSSIIEKSYLTTTWTLLISSNSLMVRFQTWFCNKKCIHKNSFPVSKSEYWHTDGAQRLIIFYSSFWLRMCERSWMLWKRMSKSDRTLNSVHMLVFSFNTSFQKLLFVTTIHIRMRPLF